MYYNMRAIDMLPQSNRPTGRPGSLDCVVCSLPPLHRTSVAMFLLVCCVHKFSMRVFIAGAIVQTVVRIVTIYSEHYITKARNSVSEGP